MRWLALVFTLVSITVTADEARIKQAITGINPMIQIESVSAVDQTPFLRSPSRLENAFTPMRRDHILLLEIFIRSAPAE